jgi:hypothetical protein
MSLIVVPFTLSEAKLDFYPTPFEIELETNQSEAFL